MHILNWMFKCRHIHVFGIHHMPKVFYICFYIHVRGLFSLVPFMSAHMHFLYINSDKFWPDFRVLIALTINVIWFAPSHSWIWNCTTIYWLSCISEFFVKVIFVDLHYWINEALLLPFYPSSFKKYFGLINWVDNLNWPL